MLTRLGHVTVLSTDLERTGHFYCGLLGLRPGPRPAIGLPGIWLYLGADAVVHVLPRQRTPAPEGEPAIDHFALVAHDRPAFEHRLSEAGVAFSSQRLADSDVWQVFVTDPDGARVELSFAGADAVATP